MKLSSETDIRPFAAALIGQMKREGLPLPIFAYGTPSRVLVAMGFQDSMTVSGNEWRIQGRTNPRQGLLAETGCEALADFVQRNDSNWIAGFIGFDFNAVRYSNVRMVEHIHTMLFSPQKVVEITSAGSRTLFGSDISFRTPDVLPEPQQKLQTSPIEVPPGILADFGRRVETALQWVGNDPQRRLTISTEIPLSKEVDPLIVFSQGSHDECGLARSLYYCGHDYCGHDYRGHDYRGHDELMEIGGTSPELLLNGSFARSIRIHKLAGTSGVESHARLQDNQRLAAEHHSSLTGLVQTLSRIGRIQVLESEVELSLPTLRHLLTTLELIPSPHIGMDELLLSSLPTGANPPALGLQHLWDTNQIARGPYYGLFGVATPDRSMSWSQLLRTVVRSRGLVRLPVGAAVTCRSTPALEMEEIALKVGSVTVPSCHP